MLIVVSHTYTIYLIWFSDGQAVGVRVSKLLSINTRKINKELSDLNAFAADPIEFGTVASPVSDIYRELNRSTLSSWQQWCWTVIFATACQRGKVKHQREVDNISQVFTSAESCH